MESRLTEVEVKLAFQDEMLDALNLTVTRQQQQIDMLQQLVRDLYLQQQTTQNQDNKPQHEIPPHY